MLVTVGQPLRKARTTTTGPCRVHTVFGPTCVSIMARAIRAGSMAQSPATSQCDGPAVGRRSPGAGVGLEIGILAMAQNPGRGPAHTRSRNAHPISSTANRTSSPLPGKTRNSRTRGVRPHAKLREIAPFRA